MSLGSPLATADTINDVIASLHPGQQFIYHVGSLMYDRKKGSPQTFLTIDGAAKAAWNAYQNGDVTLIQRRLNHIKFEYILIKRAPKPPKKAVRNAPGKSVTVPVNLEEANGTACEPVL